MGISDEYRRYLYARAFRLLRRINRILDESRERMEQRIQAEE